MKIQIDLQKEDWKLYQAYIEKELPKHNKTWMDSFWVNLFGWMVIVIIFMAAFQQISHFHWPTAISVSAFFVLIKVYAYVFPEEKLDNPDEFWKYISEQYLNVTNKPS